MSDQDRASARGAVARPWRGPGSTSDKRRDVMRISRRTVVALATAAAFAGSAMTATSAFAMGTIFRSSIEPSVPTDPMLHGAEAGSAPWVLEHGLIRLNSMGELKVVVRGLIIPELGNPGPVTSIDASLYCGNETTPRCDYRHGAALCKGQRQNRGDDHGSDELPDAGSTRSTRWVSRTSTSDQRLLASAHGRAPPRGEDPARLAPGPHARQREGASPTHL